jgi:hypothetical protein
MSAETKSPLPKLWLPDLWEAGPESVTKFITWSGHYPTECHVLVIEKPKPKPYKFGGIEMFKSDLLIVPEHVKWNLKKFAMKNHLLVLDDPCPPDKDWTADFQAAVDKAQELNNQYMSSVLAKPFTATELVKQWQEAKAKALGSYHETATYDLYSASQFSRRFRLRQPWWHLSYTTSFDHTKVQSNTLRGWTRLTSPKMRYTNLTEFLAPLLPLVTAPLTTYPTFPCIRFLNSTESPRHSVFEVSSALSATSN